MKWLIVKTEKEQIVIAREINSLVAEISNEPIGTPVRLSKIMVDLLNEIAVVIKTR